MEQLNRILLHLESELAQTRAEGQHQAQEYKALLNIKVKLEAEIATYHCLLEEREHFDFATPWTATPAIHPKDQHPPDFGWQSGIQGQ